MSAIDPKTVVQAYFTAWTNKNTDAAYELLADDLQFGGPSASYKSKQEFRPGLIGFASMTKGARVLWLVAEGERVAMLYDCDLPEPVGTLRIASFFRVVGGKIKEYDTRFDATLLTPLIQKLSRN